MSNITEELSKKITALTAETDLFLVDLFIKPTNNVKVFLDGDNGVTIDAVSKLNKALYKQIEESGLFPDDNFSLEVSSAGIDSPLKMTRQYKKNVGRFLEVVLEDDSVVMGQLKSADDSQILLEIKDKKKKEVKELTLSYHAIKKAVVQVIF